MERGPCSSRFVAEGDEREHLRVAHDSHADELRCRTCEALVNQGDHHRTLASR